MDRRVNEGILNDRTCQRKIETETLYEYWPRLMSAFIKGKIDIVINACESNRTLRERRVIGDPDFHGNRRSHGERRMLTV